MAGKKRDYKALARFALLKAKAAAKKGKELSEAAREQVLKALEDSGMLGGMSREEAKQYAMRELVKAVGRSR